MYMPVNQVPADVKLYLAPTNLNIPVSEGKNFEFGLFTNITIPKGRWVCA